MLVVGHIIVQLRLVFCPMNTDYLVAYVQCFNIVSQQGNLGSVDQGTRMHLLRHVMNSHETHWGCNSSIANLICHALGPEFR